jgi:hypothetical protein
MSNTGNPAESVSSNDESPRRGVSWTFLIVLTVALVVAFILGFQLISALAVVLFPPGAPVPPDATEVSHESLARGVDRWEYVTSQPVDEVIAFFQEHEAECVAAMLPQNDIIGATERDGFHCEHTGELSIFNWRWQADVLALSGMTNIRLARTVYWADEVPPERTDVPLVESTEVSNN